MDTATKEAFAVREFCDRYGICRDTFYAEVRRGRLRALKLGKKTIILKSDAEAWAASLPEFKVGPGVRQRKPGPRWRADPAERPS